MIYVVLIEVTAQITKNKLLVGLQDRAARVIRDRDFYTPSSMIVHERVMYQQVQKQVRH